MQVWFICPCRVLLATFYIRTLHQDSVAEINARLALGLHAVLAPLGWMHNMQSPYTTRPCCSLGSCCPSRTLLCPPLKLAPFCSPVSLDSAPSCLTVSLVGPILYHMLQGIALKLMSQETGQPHLWCTPCFETIVPLAPIKWVLSALVHIVHLDASQSETNPRLSHSAHWGRVYWAVGQDGRCTSSFVV